MKFYPPHFLHLKIFSPCRGPNEPLILIVLGTHWMVRWSLTIAHMCYLCFCSKLASILPKMLNYSRFLLINEFEWESYAALIILNNKDLFTSLNLNNNFIFCTLFFNHITIQEKYVLIKKRKNVDFYFDKWWKFNVFFYER